MTRDKNVIARGMLAVAERRLRKGGIEEACATAAQAAERAPELAAVWEFLGRCHMRLGEPERARVYYRRYLALAPHEPNAIFVRAMLDEGQP
jgi:Flp pilus assembly protein TadD